MAQHELVANDIIETNTIPDNNSFIHQEQLVKLYKKFLLLNKKGYKYISLDDFYGELSLSDFEIEIIKTRKDLFYLCTQKRALLVIWVIDELRNFFVTNNMPQKVVFCEIYEHLRKVFSLHSINRSNLQELLKCDDELTYEQLLIVEKKSNSVINFAGGLYTSIQQLYKKPGKIIGRTENLKHHLRCILGINHADGSIEAPLFEAENEMLKKMSVAIEETDIVLCRNSFLFPEKVIPIINALDDFSRPFYVQKERMETLFNALDDICAANKGGKIYSLIKAYTNDAQVKSILNSVIGHCTYVSELESAFNQCIQDDNTYIKVLCFLEWLQTDLKQLVVNAISNICKDERQVKIVKGRSTGETLEEVGQKIGVTRERIRQIEVKTERSFISYYSRFRPQYIVLAFSESDIYFNSSDIYRVFGENTDIFIYFVKKSNTQSITWSDELDAFIVGNCSWYKDVLREVDALPEQISVNQMLDVVCDVKERLGISIEDDIIERIIVSYYKQIGSIYSKSHISKKDMYKIVFERYYPNGMKLFDDYEMMRFKARLKDVFPNIDIRTDDTRAISMRITDFTILYDRGKYILPTAIQIQPDLLADIHSFILNNERSTIMFTEIFERYKLQLLEKSNIRNRYFLQGVLKYHWNDEFEFSRDTISHGSVEDRSIRRHIEDFIKEQQRAVTIKEIKDEFLGITDIVISMALADNSDILLWGVGEYIHVSLIEIGEKEIAKLKQSLDTELIEGSISTRALYEHIFATDARLLNDNEIYNHIALFSVYLYLFPDEYSFSRPFISIRGVEGTTTDTIIKQYISSFNELTITDLKAYLEDMHIRIMNFSALIDNNCSDFLRADEDLLVRDVNFSITESIINEIEDSVLSILGDKGYIAAKDFNGFFFFPYIGIKWTPHLLVSFIKKYCKKLEIAKYILDYRYMTEIIVKKSLKIKNYDELILHALRWEDNKAPFANADDAETFLKSKGLITTTIPQSLYDNGWVVINEFGGIQII